MTHMCLNDAGKRRADAEKERSAATLALTEAVRQAGKRGMTPTQIAKQAGVSRQTVHAMLKKEP